jgi:hypothetical protein
LAFEPIRVVVLHVHISRKINKFEVWEIDLKAFIVKAYFFILRIVTLNTYFGETSKQTVIYEWLFPNWAAELFIWILVCKREGCTNCGSNSNQYVFKKI